MSFTADDYEELLKKLNSLADEDYKSFSAALVPGEKPSYGIRLPQLRKIAGEIAKDDAEGFLKSSSPGSFEEVMLRGMVISCMKAGTDVKISAARDFLPYITNWSVCDSFCAGFKLSKAEKPAFWRFLQPYFSDEREFYARFAAVMLLSYFVSDKYIDDDLRLLSEMKQEQYYVKMAVSWAVAECFVKYRDKTLELIKAQVLSPFVQNKAIQKIRESFRVSDDDKKLLLSYKKARYGGA